MSRDSDKEKSFLPISYLCTLIYQYLFYETMNLVYYLSIDIRFTFWEIYMFGWYDNKNSIFHKSDDV